MACRKSLIFLIGIAIIKTIQCRECACVTNNVNMRSGPGTQYNILRTLYYPICLTYLGVTVTSGSYHWAKVDYNSNNGWISDHRLTISSCPEAVNECACATTNVNIRNGPGTNYTQLHTLSSSSCVAYKGNEIARDGYYWSHVDYNGQDAFIADAFINTGPCCNAETIPQGCPNIISRSEWGASSPVNSPTSLTSVPQNVYVHHSAGPTCRTQADCIARVQGIQAYHMNTNNFNDIGYSFLIGEDGNVYEGRGWMIEGAHTSGHNTDGYGFCVMGTWSSENPNIAAQRALRRLIQCGVDNGYLASGYVLQGHRDVGSTACPGQSLYDMIQRWPHYVGSGC